MKYQNTWKRILCVLLAVCSILSGINFNRMETGAKVNEKKLYMDYLAKTHKKWKKELKQKHPEDPSYFFKELVEYKILDLGGDGRKELIYTLRDWNPYGTPYFWGWICTLKKGKVHKVWSGSLPDYDFYRIKGEKKKLVISSSCFSYGGVPCEVYTFSSGKMKKEKDYFCQLDPNSPNFIYSENEKRVKEPFGHNDNKLKPIKLKIYK